MRNSSAHHKGGIGTGSVSLILIFAVLCLTIFALLTVSSARAEYNLADKTASSVSAYYQADSQAEYVFARIRADLAQGDGVPEEISGIPINRFITGNGDDEYIAYSVPADPVNILEVTLVYSYLTQAFDIAQWRLMPAQEWYPQEDFNVWDGEFVLED